MGTYYLLPHLVTDDAQQTNDGINFNNSNPVMSFQSNTTAATTISHGFRFKIPIAKNTTSSSCTLSLGGWTTAKTQNHYYNYNVSFQAVDNATTFADSAGNRVVDRTAQGNTVSFSGYLTSSGQVKTTPSFHTSLNATLARTGWVSGNYAVVLCLMQLTNPFLGTADGAWISRRWADDPIGMASTAVRYPELAITIPSGQQTNTILTGHLTNQGTTNIIEFYKNIRVTGTTSQAEIDASTLGGVYTDKPVGFGADIGLQKTLYPNFFEIVPLFGPDSANAAVTWNISDNPNAAAYTNSSSLSDAATSDNGDSYSWFLPLSYGTWDLKIIYPKVTSGGIFDIYLDDNLLTTIDQYGSSAWNFSLDIKRINITSNGVYELKFVANGKNGLSSDYILLLQAISMYKVNS